MAQRGGFKENIYISYKKTIHKSLQLESPPSLRHEIVSVCLFEAQLFAGLFTSGGQALEKFLV